jgi:hypothetical protein
MKWLVTQDEWYPVFSIYPPTAECGPEIELTAEEEAQIRKADEDFSNAQNLICQKLDDAGLLDNLGYITQKPA